MATAVATKSKKGCTDSSAVIEIKALVQHIQACRKELGRLVETHDLADLRWQRIDEGLGEADCGLEELLDDVKRTA